MKTAKRTEADGDRYRIHGNTHDGDFENAMLDDKRGE